jgi:protocatechuate 3,4-dioxygenase alpha subunit
VTAPERPIATGSQTVGPFFHFALAPDAGLGTVAPENVKGERIHLRVTVLDGDGMAVPDALVEIYQADAQGRYRDPAFAGFGRLATGHDGACTFLTVHPGPVRPAAGPAQAPHINVCLLARGLLRQIYTRIYFQGDSGHDADPMLALVPADRRATLVAARVGAADATVERHPMWEFVVRMQGQDETVFFDI